MSMFSCNWQKMFEHPPVISNKDQAPLAIYGTMVDDPEIDVESGYPRCTGANIQSIYALQLDYDSGVTIEQFRNKYLNMRYSLYTSYSYGFKPCDRFRVVVPLRDPLPCYLLQNHRVKENIKWHFPGIDPSAADRGHWQILPAIRSKDAPYVHIKNEGVCWGSADVWAEYERWFHEDQEEFAKRLEEARNKPREIDPEELIQRMLDELNTIPVGQGQRHSAAKRILTKYAHLGIADMLCTVPCPWADKKWQREWDSLISWVEENVKII